ncbi:MAG: SPOR domain-containing protein [Alphaproteobacteria bacterium]|nr:SPOR domain-containing protein [Alphaproteobacteria bacterium]
MEDQVDENLDLLDLEENNNEVESLPEETPFSSPHPKKPWLLLGVGVAIVVLATYVIVKTINSDSENVVHIDLDAPVDTPVVAEQDLSSVKDLSVPVKPIEVDQKKEEKKIEQETSSVPVRVIPDRKEVTFNPNNATKTVAQPIKKDVVKPQVQKTAVTTTSKSWYVQFSSHSTRALAEAAEKQLRKGHSSLFVDKQFVILAAVLPNGQTTYRLRVAFNNSAEANGFCRNAKSDGLDCYVAR